ncbi:hypothetical protein MBAV_004685 [Candidatus Magnetobacterium bavaricum]|uniref:Uncharacterized protein n=1 Tax=Candidatus Magnetobacterium bavaricum TaxID=29290 RepID=A0A0F3GMJ8_9BACT|nr:hypothetical protein MBAV_004685 [Candidatus Magnetobacterium bavaricum]
MTMQIILEARVDRLENLMAEMIERQMEQDRKFDEHIRQEKEAMEAFRQEMRAKDARSDKAIEAFRQEMRAMEVRFEEQNQKDKEERKEERKAFERQINKVSADNAKLLGSLVENIIAPGAKPLIRQYFKCEPNSFRVRASETQGANNCEVDILIISAYKAFMIEVKSKPDGRDVKKILDKAKTLPTFFTECAGKQIVPMLASTFVEDNIIAYATRKGLHVVAYRQWEYLDILNFDAIRDKDIPLT